MLKIAQEFVNSLFETKISPLEVKIKTLEEKVNTLGNLLERIMMLILKLPESFDQNLLEFNRRLSAIEGMVKPINKDINLLKTADISAPEKKVLPPPPSPNEITKKPPIEEDPRKALMKELKDLIEKRK